MPYQNFPYTDFQNLNLDWILQKLLKLLNQEQDMVVSVNGKTGVVVLTAADLGAYVKPAGGIPSTDMSTAVRSSLTRANSAYVKPLGGIPKLDLANAVQTSLSKADSALQTAPVLSVNNKTGTVTLTYSDVGASKETERETINTGTATIDAEDSTLYICGTMSSIEINSFPSTGIWSVIFTSGTTATVFVPATGMVMPNDFSVEANKRYEINVMDGYAVVAEWSTT